MKNAIKKAIESYSNKEMQAFGNTLIKTKYHIYGLKIAQMKTIAKDILAGQYGDVLELLEKLDAISYEEIMIKGYVIASYKGIDIEKRLELLEELLPDIDNWANCDSIVASCKFIKKNKLEMWDFSKRLLVDSREYYLRFGIGILMDYYMEDSYIVQSLKIVSSICSDYYYVKMMIAWYFATALVKYYDLTIPYIESQAFDKFVQNKIISKAHDSYQITPEVKAYLATFRIK